MGIVEIVILLCILGAIYNLVQRIKTKAIVSLKKNSKPEDAVKALEDAYLDEAISEKKYVKELEKLINQTGYVGAIKKLVDFYTKDEKDDKKRMYWEQRLVMYGDLQSILEYYGFTDYDVSSDKYEDMLRDLNKASILDSTEPARSFADYFRGVVNFRMGRLDDAKKLFATVTSPELKNNSVYMSFRCLLKEGNIPDAEKILMLLEEQKFAIPADSYLELYNIYVAKREGGTLDYEAEVRYADSYSGCKDADSETANRISRTSYYQLATALQNGSNGYVKNTDRALKFYEKAANLGHREALYLTANDYWRGIHFRDYYKAIQFMCKAAQAGHKQAREILDQYGFDGILIKTIQPNDAEYRFLDNYVLTASDKMIQWLQMYHGISYKRYVIASAFENNYKDTFQSFEQMVNGVHQLYTDSIAVMLEWCVSLLVSFGIDTYSAEDILEGCEDLSLLPRVPRFEANLERIDNRAAQLHTQTNYAKATRGVWSGAGFGTSISSTISASVQASVAAGVMNIGSGILHGIGDSIVESMNNSEIKSMGKKVFEDKNTLLEFKQAVSSACRCVVLSIMHIIEQHSSNIKYVQTLKGTIKFAGEDLSKINDRILATKINNNLSVEKYEYVYALLVEALRRNPLGSKDIFEQLFELTVRRGEKGSIEAYESCLRYAGDFSVNLSDQQRTWAETLLASGSKSDNDNGKTCPNCGNKIKPGKKFCSKCGTAVS